MKNPVLQSYLNISKLLELTPNTNEYNKHRQTVPQDELEAVKHLKEKQADKKYKELKKQTT